MDQEKRVLAAFALSFLMLMLWRVFFVKEPPPKPSTKPNTAVATQPASQKPAAAAVPSPPLPPTLPVVEGSKTEDIVVENDLYKVTFSTRGAVVENWILKRYRDAKEAPLDLVDDEACGKLGFPMSLKIADEALSNKLNSALYVGTPTGTALEPPVKLEFSYSDGTVQVRKVFTFEKGYDLNAEVSVVEGGHYRPVEVTWPGGFGDHSLAPAIINTYAMGVYGAIGNLTTVAQRKLSADRSVPAPLQLAGLEDRYFAGIFVPDSPDETFKLGRQTWTPTDWSGKDSDKPSPIIAQLGEEGEKPLAFRMFVGPKNLDVLRAQHPPLDSLVDFGWFALVAKPLFLGLVYIYDHWVHNYGWAIVILTLLINFAMFPLKLKSIRSAQEMQRIAPLIKSIQDKYKNVKFNDPKKGRMNEEMMNLYKEHGVNPLGGCLPMALQLPFLYGFYRVLELPIELRHAPWIWWIKDLSAPDKFHPFGFPLPILPTVMVISMFLMQKMTPMTTADPSQQRMMMFMPVIFGIMFYNFASGLVLYFLTANMVGIAQQLLINKFMPMPQAVPAPAARSK
ncbi:putative Membrane protein insertase YidC [Acidobacteriia bacterium SbA2]|nr:putative Membrane protein insertase YidC [Acidobacteriia bacterium SbA2]